MKKRILPLLLILPLTMSSCAVTRLFELWRMKKDREIDPIRVELDDNEVDVLIADGFELVESKNTYGRVEYTLEELYAGLTNGTPSDQSGAPLATIPNPDPDEELNSSDIAINGVTVKFSDEAWEDRANGEVDITAEMTPEQLEMYNEIINADLESEFAELESSMDGMSDSFTEGGDIGSGEVPDINVGDIQSQLEQALKEAQEALGESGYGDLIPDIDIGGLLGGLLG